MNTHLQNKVGESGIVRVNEGGREIGERPFSSPSAVESCDLLKRIRGNLNQPNCYQVDNIFSAFIH